MTVSKFYLPDVGEGLTEAEIVSWKVKPGDSVAINDVLVEIETAKSLVELPSPFEGVVSELLVAEGKTVEVGTPIITIAAEGHSQLTAPTPTLAQAAMANEVFVTDETETDGAQDVSSEASGAVLVGYGVAGHGTTRRRRGHAAAAQAEHAAANAAAAAEAGAETFRMEAMGLPYEQGVFKYQLKCLADLRSRHAGLDSTARAQVDPLLGDRWLALLGG